MPRSTRKRTRTKKQKPPKSHTYSIDKDLNLALNELAIKRTGGAINFRGLGYQLLYSCFTLVNELDNSTPEKTIRLEGIEDIDIIEVDSNEYIQLKSSVNIIDAGSFWKMGVLQNFLEAFKINSNCSLKLVYNFKPSKGNLNDIIVKEITDETIAFWKKKFEDSSINVSDINFDSFIRSIDFVTVSESYLLKNCNKHLLEKFNINLGIVNQYLKALFYNSFIWSRERTSVKYLDLKKVFQSVTDDFSKSPTNPAIENNWIQKIDFDDLTNSTIKDDYYEGKAARPIHIVQGLPVKRKEWYNQTLKGLNEHSIIIIKSSSGQGKSTLAWQISFDLTRSGYSIYEIKYCIDNSSVAGLLDFIESRVKIGELPIIVIDGLNSNLSKYYELIDKTYLLPLKFIITTRHVDWNRYGLDLSKSSSKIIDISLSGNEAKEIFFELKKSGKIHSEILNWQSIWEEVESKGLLIEYVYLLTKGEMLSSRLSTQIKEVNSETGAASKIEILRIISIADVLGLKIKSLNLINYIHKNIGFTADRGETLKQLEKEFYLRFDDEFIEGLHPVRSQHLVDILNHFIPISDTLLSLYKIITEEFIYDFFISVPPLIKSTSKDSFYNDLAKIVSTQKFSEMVQAIDGLMHSEPLQYWKVNKVVFNEVFKQGGIELFITETLPFTKLGTIKKLNESIGDQFSSLSFLLEKTEELTPYSIEKSDIVKFTYYLSSHLDMNLSNIVDYQGLGFLIKWFKQLSVSVPQKIKFNESELLKVLKNEPIDVISELFSYYSISKPKRYIKFVEKHKDLVISLLKRHTNSLSIIEKGKEIHINYLLDKDVEKANEFSVDRIQTVYGLLPIYDKYCTTAIILPFPNEEIYKAVLQDSIKAMPKENIINTFDVHINQIWNNTLLDKYRSSSSYNWQSQYIKLRKEAVDFAKICIRYFESFMEGNQSKLKSSLNKLIAQITSLSNSLNQTKGYPRQSRKYFENGRFSKHENKISDWCSSLRNAINQLVNVVEPKKDNERNVAFINIKVVLYKLTLMQQSFDKIVDSSFMYHNTFKLKKEEKVWYTRLVITVSYYIIIYINSNQKRIFNSKQTIQNWWEIHNKRKLTETLQIIKDFEMESDFSFHLPHTVIQSETISEVVIGITGLKFENAEDIFYLFQGLSNLASTEIDFFYFISIQNTQAIGNGFRVHKEFFKKIKAFIETGEFEESSYGNPLPINVDETLLESLNGITIKENPSNKTAESFSQMMHDVWKLSEYRNRLNKKSVVELEWLEEIEESYSKKIQKYMESLDIPKNLKVTLDNFLKKDSIMLKKDVVEILTEYFVSLKIIEDKL